MIKRAIILFLLASLMAGCAQAESSDFQENEIVEEVTDEIAEEVKE
jgi:Na+-transporting methylmalonyl-CoA/oxaloacetate decarboxylase gamma subunit